MVSQGAGGMESKGDVDGSLGGEGRDLLGAALGVRVTALRILACATPPQTVILAANADASDAGACEPIWQECLAACSSLKPPAEVAAVHFARILAAGLDANAVPFPHKILRPEKVPAMLPPLVDGRCSVDGNERSFPMPAKRSLLEVGSASSGADQEAQTAWAARLACEPGELRKAMHRSSKKLDMELVPWPMKQEGVIARDECLEMQLKLSARRDKLSASSCWRDDLARAKADHDYFTEMRYLRSQMHKETTMLEMGLKSWPMKEDGVIARDECTTEQLHLLARREKRGLPGEKQVARRRARVIDPRFFDEVRPMLEKEAAFAEMRARWASDRALEARLHDEAAAAGEALATWPLAGKWPAPPLAWARHASWFKFWRAAQMRRLAEARKATSDAEASMTKMNEWRAGLAEASYSVAGTSPMKLRRSTSGTSDASWEAVSECSDASWQALSEASWQDVAGNETEVAGPAEAEAQRAQALEEATSAMVAAKESLMRLNKADFAELKALAKPPAGVDDAVGACVCLLRNDARLPNWKGCQKVLGSPGGFLGELKVFDAGKISEATMHRLEALAKLPHFNFDAMKIKSLAAASLVSWVLNSMAYHESFTSVKKLSKTNANLQFAERAEVTAECLSPEQEEMAAELPLPRLTASWEKAKQAVKDALGNITKKSISELKCLGKPPPLCIAVCEAVGLILGVPASDWKTSQKMMCDPAALLMRIRCFDVTGMPEARAVKAREFIKARCSDHDAMVCASAAAAALSEWAARVTECRVLYGQMVKAAAQEHAAMLTQSSPEDLDLKAKPLYDDALKALEVLEKADITEVKSYASPPMLVKDVLCTVCAVFGFKETWEEAKRLMGNTNFMDSLKHFDIVSLAKDKSRLQKLRAYANRQVFASDRVAAVSRAAASINAWLLALDQYCQLYSALVLAESPASAEGGEESSKAIESDKEKEASAGAFGVDKESSKQALEDWAAALNVLTKADIVELKCLGSPPSGVKQVLMATCIMLGVPPHEKQVSGGKGEVEDYWPTAKKEIGDVNLLSKLCNYDKDNIPESVISKIMPIYESEEFQPDNIKRASKAAASLCRWVRALVEYHRAAQALAQKGRTLDEDQCSTAPPSPASGSPSSPGGPRYAEGLDDHPGDSVPGCALAQRL
mmetsp:Transcript_1087/g.2652  ORF Transcript_1087/g.2652 Transcript_1087/m.2652 type:complete len:1151 (+) Transcript_1087:73-3525(+)